MELAKMLALNTEFLDPCRAEIEATAEKNEWAWLFYARVFYGALIVLALTFGYCSIEVLCLGGQAVAFVLYLGCTAAMCRASYQAAQFDACKKLSVEEWSGNPARWFPWV